MDLSGRAALLIVDVQLGLFGRPSPSIHDSDAVLDRISRLATRARAQSIPVIYTRFLGPSGSALGEGSPGSTIHPAVAPMPGDIIVEKRDSDAFLGSSLRAELSKRGVEKLVVCGLQSEFCIDSTCRAGYSLGYSVYLVQDSHTTADSEDLDASQIVAHHNATLGRAYVTLCVEGELFH